MKTHLLWASTAVLAFATLAGSAVAQSNFIQPSAGFIGWNAQQAKSPEVTVSGTIQQVINFNQGSHSGYQLLLSTPQGTVRAELGPYLARVVRDSLTEGASVQIVGQVQTVGGQTYISGRQMTAGGRSITIRNEQGSLVRSRQKARVHSQSLTAENGGTR